MKMDISELNNIAGFIGGCVADSKSGLLLEGIKGISGFDLDAAAALSIEVVRANNDAIMTLGMNDKIENIMVELDNTLHLIRRLKADSDTFIYVGLDRKHANLGMARVRLKQVADSLSV